jgi:hypothetical protein
VRSSANGATVTVCFDSPIAYVPPASWAIPSRAGVAAGSPGSGDATTADADGVAAGAGALPTAAELEGAAEGDASTRGRSRSTSGLGGFTAGTTSLQAAAEITARTPQARITVATDITSSATVFNPRDPTNRVAIAAPTPRTADDSTTP